MNLYRRTALRLALLLAITLLGSPGIFTPRAAMAGFDNTPPTITASATLTRQQGSPPANVQIATVMDVEDAEDALTVTVNGGASATVNAVTVAGLAVSASGQVTANVLADCAATDASFTLTVTDQSGATANAALMVAVTANTSPTLSYNSPQMVLPGGSLNIDPAKATDNGTISLYSIIAVTPPLDPALGINIDGTVLITNAGPAGNHIITVQATDNCGVTRNASFELQVSACGATLSKISQSFAANGGADSFAVNLPAGCQWMATTTTPWITITSPTVTVTGSGTVSYTVTNNIGSSPRSGTISVAGETFTVLQGVTFNDVPLNDPFYEFISKLSARGVTQGCGGGNFCPEANVTREQMAAFIIRSLGDFNPPPPATQRFLDVPPSHPFYAFIEQLALRGITAGCGGRNYCPTAPVTREQMAAFIIRALHTPGYVPPAPAAQRFTDVPPSNPFYAHIDELAALGITAGCGGGNYCPAANVTRGQMAAFLVRAFGL